MKHECHHPIKPIKPFNPFPMTLATILFAAVQPVTHASTIPLLDNTAQATSALAQVGSAMSNSTQKAYIFQTGATAYNLSIVTLGLFTQGSTSANFTLELYLADGNNNPTGSALASQSFSQPFTATTAYYTFNLSGFSLDADTNYAFLIRTYARA